MAKIVSNSKKRRSNATQAKLMLAPMLIGFIIFTYVPIIYILRFSFFDSNGFTSTWVGLDNFIRVFTRDAAFWK